MARGAEALVKLSRAGVVPAHAPCAGLSLQTWPGQGAARAAATLSALPWGCWARLGEQPLLEELRVGQFPPQGGIGDCVPIQRTCGVSGRWETCWVGLKFKGQEPGLIKIYFPSAPALTYCFLHGQNSIESKPEDGLERGNIVFGCKQLCLEVNISELWDQTETPT